MDIKSLLQEKGDSVATVAPDASIREAVAKLHERRVGALVVSRDGQSIEGIFSERDVVRGLSTHGAALIDLPVSDFMTKDVKTCGLNANIQDIMGDMTRNRFRHLPVVEGGKLRGIISIGDVVKNRLEELENETSALREFIVGHN